MSDHESREETCPDCGAGPHNMDSRVITAGTDKATGAIFTTVTWHTKNCPAYTVDRILGEESARKAKERTEWGRKAFPAAFERVMSAALTLEFDEKAKPFVAALMELVAAQGEDLDRVVLPDRWAEILDQHFPPDEPTA